MAFIPSDLDINGLQVNHLDLDPNNNHYKNLEWVTQQENIIHSVIHRTDLKKSYNISYR